MSIYNEDELEAPAWLNHEFLENVLRKHEKQDNLELIELKITPATLKGDHFASCMFRAKVEYRTVGCKKIASLNLIIKTLPEEHTTKGQMLKDSKIFETEISMYTEALPKIEQILAEYGDGIRFGPKVIYTALKPIKVIIFEDLCELGYDALRGRYLSMDEVKDVLIKLAKFHAVSYTIGKSSEAEAVAVTKYTDGLFKDPLVFQADLMSGGIKRFRNLLESNEELRVYLEYFVGIEKEVQECCLELYNAYKNGDENAIFVLNHGDFHLKNLMFKFDEENRCEDIMFVDFQISLFGPSTIDLTYATFMLLSPQQRLEKHDEIMRFYFEQFIATLKKIDFQGKFPSFGQFQLSSLTYRKFTVFLLTTFLPMVHQMAANRPEDLKDIDAVEAVTNTDVLMSSYQNQALIEELKTILPVLLKKGYFVQ